MCEDQAVARKSTQVKPGARRYHIDYLQYGFYWNQNESDPRPLCLLCKTILANEAMVPTKLSRHLTTIHKEATLKTVEHF